MELVRNTSYVRSLPKDNESTNNADGQITVTKAGLMRGRNHIQAQSKELDVRWMLVV
jgi:hypothetical protein